MKHFTISLLLLFFCSQNYAQSVDLLGHWTGLRLKAGPPISNSISLDFNHPKTMLHYEKERMAVIETEMNWSFSDNQLILINPITNEKKIGSVVQQKENFLVFKFNTDTINYFYAIYRTDIRYEKAKIKFPKNLKSVNVKSNINAKDIPDLNIAILDSLNVLTNSSCNQLSFPLSFLQIGPQVFTYNRSFFLQVITSNEHNIQLNNIVNEAVYTFSDEIITDQSLYQTLVGKWEFERKSPKASRTRTIKVGRLHERIDFNEDGSGIFYYNDTTYLMRWLPDSNNRIHIIVRPNETTGQFPPYDSRSIINGPIFSGAAAYYQFDIEELNEQRCKFKEVNCDGLNFFYGKRLE